MKLSADQKKTIAKTLPKANNKALKKALINQIEKVLFKYEHELLISRDTYPTASEIRAQAESVRIHLEAAMLSLVRSANSESLAVIGLLGAMLDGTEQASASFIEKLTELITSAQKVIENCEPEKPLYFDGEIHKRRTRTRTRDRYLIPMLTGISSAYGGLDLLDDYEDLDVACNFVSTVLSVVQIPCPDPGDTSAGGETAQGRLRRQIKEAAKKNQQILAQKKAKQKRT